MSLPVAMEVQAFYEGSYDREGFAAQRRYPNEELCRFMGRNYFGVPLDQRRDVRILELGCGSGANLWMIAREGFEAHGIDLSQGAIGLCRQMLANYDAPATLSVGDMTSCPYPNQHFDGIVDVFSSNCLDERQFATLLKEVQRLLKPGGQFFCYTPSKASDAFRNHAPAKLIDPSTLNGIYRADSPFSGNHYPFRFATVDELSAGLRECGLQVTYGETVGRTYSGGKEYFEFVVISARKP